MKLVIALLVLGALFCVTRADIPVHCEIAKVIGKWSFEMTSQNQNNSVVSTCHMKTKSLPFPVAQTVELTLSLPDVAQDSQGNKGFFTMIYDEGMEVVIDNRKFFAFFNYTGWLRIVSHCDQTFTGTFHEIGVNPQKWGCFRGKKIVGAEMQPVVTTVELPKIHSVANQKFVNNVSFINELNTMQNLWEAAEYKQFEGKTYSEMFRMAGRYVSTTKRLAHERHMRFMRQFKTHLSGQNVPENLDWRKVNDTNYVSSVRDQESCGSCYAFGTTGMLESRVRILTGNKQQPIFSPQNIVSCSTYSQGCQGGIEYLVEKYGEDFGLVEEKCEPYHGHDDKCRNKCPIGQVTHVTDYKFVGGYYGGCNEQEMINHLVNEGPMVVGFFVHDDFFHYKHGIYRHLAVTGHDNKFINVNHAVLMVGYGVSGHVKYWTCKNSWGSGWGDSGYFKIIRGVDECGIESEASVARPVVQ